MTWLELKIPPPIVALALGLLMWLASSFAQPFEVPFAWRLGITLILLAAGECFAVSGMVAFRRAKTTMNPNKASTASSLVTNGIYRVTRNPMYLGRLFTLSAWAAFLSNPLALLFLPLYVLYIDRFQIVPEERVLMSIFGDEYIAYKKRVRRWL